MKPEVLLNLISSLPKRPKTVTGVLKRSRSSVRVVALRQYMMLSMLQVNVLTAVQTR